MAGNAHLRKQAVRLATVRDACEIALLSRSQIEYGLPWVWTPAAVARSIADTETNVVVAGKEGAIDGFAVVYFGRTHAHISLLAVAPEARRRGLATKLLDWQTKAARVAGIRYMTLEVRSNNVDAQAFYKANGFKESDTVPRYYRNNEDALRMVKRLEIRQS